MKEAELSLTRLENSTPSFTIEYSSFGPFLVMTDKDSVAGRAVARRRKEVSIEGGRGK
jgi:hypothetical protein